MVCSDQKHTDYLDGAIHTRVILNSEMIDYNVVV
jgi:hypothetical protein